MMGGIWALLGVLFLLLSMLVSTWYRGRGKMLKGVEVDVEGKTEKEKMWKIIFTSSTTSIAQ
jgi:hypothetical protein